MHPEIPQNTGNIVRTCAGTGAELILVRPLGFSITHRRLKRAGLDYWEGVSVTLIDDLVAYLESTSAPFFFFSSHATKRYTDVSYPKDALLIFGSETQGLDPIYKEKWPSAFVTIPMQDSFRCLNLSNAAAIAIYEAWRQHDFFQGS